jgi:hypothetical protein
MYFKEEIDMKKISALFFCIYMCLLLPTFAGEAFAATPGILLDIDNDGTEEITEYVEERNVLRITKGSQPIVEANLNNYGVNFSGMGMFSSAYFFEYVKDATGMVFLHIYTSDLVTDTDEDGKRVSAAVDTYYSIGDNELVTADIANFNWLYDRAVGESEMANITINGQPVNSLDSIKAKYTAIENTRFDIEPQ